MPHPSSILLRQCKRALTAMGKPSQTAEMRRAAALRYFSLERRLRAALKKQPIRDRVTITDLRKTFEIVAEAGYPVMASRLLDQNFRNIAYIPLRNRSHVAAYLTAHIDEAVALKATRHLRTAY